MVSGIFRSRSCAGCGWERGGEIAQVWDDDDEREESVMRVGSVMKGIRWMMCEKVVMTMGNKNSDDRKS